MTDYLQHRTDLSNPAVVTVFDELTFWSSRFGHLLFQHIPLGPNRHILDLACGLGFPLFELAHASGPSCRLVGADPWRAALDRAERKRRVYGLANVALVQTDGAALPLPPGHVRPDRLQPGDQQFRAARRDPGRMLSAWPGPARGLSLPPTSLATWPSSTTCFAPR